jgi:hypothetical protein
MPVVELFIFISLRILTVNTYFFGCFSQRRVVSLDIELDRFVGTALRQKRSAGEIVTHGKLAYKIIMSLKHL